MAKTMLTVEIRYDPKRTDPEGLAVAMDRLLETVLCTPRIMDDYGSPVIGEFLVAGMTKKGPKAKRGPGHGQP